MEHDVNKLCETLGSIIQKWKQTYLHRPNIPLGLKPKPSTKLLGETEKWKRHLPARTQYPAEIETQPSIKLLDETEKMENDNQNS